MPYPNLLTNSSSFVLGGRFDGTSVSGIVTAITLMRSAAVKVEVKPQNGPPKYIIVLDGFGEVLA